MEFPLVAMIARAGWVARSLMVLLLAESIVSWAIIIHRFLYLGAAAKFNRRFQDSYEGMRSLVECKDPGSGMGHSTLAQMARITAGEFNRILDDANQQTGAKDWSFYLQNQFAMVSEKMDAVISTLSAKLDKGVFLLAIISSSAPFLGLLGTVWGIMDSFYEIGNQGSASLPVVAPGIAEALIMTAIGLVVAIPAVFFYNFFMHRVARLEDEMDEFKEHLCSRLRREIFSLIYAGRK
jgi:biopolymer transport protein TolQ